MNNNELNLPAAISILESNTDQIIETWLAELEKNESFTECCKVKKLVSQSKHIIDSLLSVSKKHEVPNYTVQELEPVMKLLFKLNTVRDTLSLDPQNTALYLYTLKKAFIDTIKANSDNSLNLSEEISKFNNLLDIMGIFVLEELSNKHKAQVEKKDAVISYLSYKDHEEKKFDIIGQSIKMQDIFKQIGSIVDTDVTVLIQGDSGTGKELISQVIHYNSDRKKKPFIAINCGAIPHELIESELFGHIKGSFTGAIADKTGKFELASEGTIFLDEIGELPMQSQVKLLRVLQNKKFTKVGGTVEITTNARIIAATNRKLEEMIAEKTFREDLYYRLNVFPIFIPPLSQRIEDIIPLALHYLDQYADKYNKKIIYIDEVSTNMLKEYSWPGNIRELENMIHRAVILCKTDTISLNNLNTEKLLNTNYIESEENKIVLTLAEAEKKAIERAITINGGNVKKSAEQLGISRTTLYSKIKEYSISY